MLPTRIRALFFNVLSTTWASLTWGKAGLIQCSHRQVWVFCSYLPGRYAKPIFSSVQFSSVQSLSRVRLFATPWIAAHQASLSITNSQSSLKFMSIESVMPSSHLILCRPLLLLPPIPPSIRVFPNESTLCMRWPKYWSFFHAKHYLSSPLLFAGQE